VQSRLDLPEARAGERQHGHDADRHDQRPVGARVAQPVHRGVSRVGRARLAAARPAGRRRRRLPGIAQEPGSRLLSDDDGPEHGAHPRPARRRRGRGDDCARGAGRARAPAPGRSLVKLDCYMLTHDLKSVPAYSRKVEALGFDCLWTAETQHDPFLPLAIAATATTRLKLGTAIAVAFPRSPMITAHIAWDLQKASDGRFCLGLGSQIKGHNERRFSVKFESRGQPLREYVQPAVEEGLAAGRRQRHEFSYVTSTFTIVGDTEQERADAREAVRQQIGFYASTRTYEPVLASHGWQDLAKSLHRKSVEGDWVGMAKLLTDEMVDPYAVTGTWDTIGAKIRERYAGLLDRTSFYKPCPPGLGDP